MPNQVQYGRFLRTLQFMEFLHNNVSFQGVFPPDVAMVRLD
jgi:hypothetical protein